MGLVVSGRYLRLIIGKDQIPSTVILPVQTVFLRTFNDSGVITCDVPAGDVQRFTAQGG
ncbi:hypothetical protein I5080_01630 [Salmonella enterica]|nr:hypothetical protein I5080_01630 [Salmonella enterica]